jgi:hypothetical protein
MSALGVFDETDGRRIVLADGEPPSRSSSAVTARFV